MILNNDANSVLHRIRVKLYPNYFQYAEGKYIARTNNEASLSIEQICAALRDRGGYKDDYKKLVENINKFFDEAVYQLCDGFSINTGYFSIHPNIGGTFNSVKDAHDLEKHPISFRFRALSRLKQIIENIAVDIDGIANVSGFIDEFNDISSGTLNETVTSGELFVINGDKIKITGDDPQCGIYFEPVRDPDNPVKVETFKLAENSPTKIIGVVPDLKIPGEYRPVIYTRFSGGGTQLKETRKTTSNFVLKSANVQTTKTDKLRADKDAVYSGEVKAK